MGPGPTNGGRCCSAEHHQQKLSLLLTSFPFSAVIGSTQHPCDSSCSHAERRLMSLRPPYASYGWLSTALSAPWADDYLVARGLFRRFLRRAQWVSPINPEPNRTRVPGSGLTIAAASP